MKLVEERMIELDDKAKAWLPKHITDNILNCNEVTIRQLLNHSSGIVNYVEDINFLLDGVNDQNKDRSWKDLLHYIYGKDAYFKTGTDFHYSNTNYVLLGKVIEGVCNETHSQTIQKNIISPLHLNCTYYDPDATIPPQMIRGYMDYHNDGKITDITSIHNHTKLYGDAGVISNVYDLMLFCEALFTGKLLADTTLRKMQEWIPTNEDEMAGLGLFSSQTDFYGQCIGHTGYTFGFLSRLFYFPEKNIVFVLLVNGSLGSISDHVTAFTKTSNNTRNKVFDAIFSDE
jgi:D-alanyl-D-alanine carboxypeptidase